MKFAALLLTASLLSPAIAASESADAESKLSALYPHINVDSVTAGPLDGVWKVLAGDNVFYFADEEELLFFGEFYSKDGVNLTATPITQEPNNKPGSAPLTIEEMDAVRVREGNPTITAFVDVRCGHCSKAVSWLVGANALPHAGLDVVFVTYKASDVERGAHVVCAPDHLKGEALLQAFELGREGEWLSCESGEASLMRQARIATKAGVVGTPVFVVNGKDRLLGFDSERLSDLVLSF